MVCDREMSLELRAMLVAVSSLSPVNIHTCINKFIKKKKKKKKYIDIYILYQIGLQVNLGSNSAHKQG